jgi:predicted DNA-binding protein YlxM (UPF0122 family)
LGLEGYDQMTLEEIAEEFGVSRERIRQIQDRATKKLFYQLRDKYELKWAMKRRQGNVKSVGKIVPEKLRIQENIYEPIPQSNRTIVTTLYDRAAGLLEYKGLCVSSEEEAILRIVAGADKETFMQVSKEVSGRFGIPDGEVVSRVLEIIINGEKNRRESIVGI